MSREIVVFVLAVLAGVAIILQFRGWTTLGSESGNACGGNHGVYGACPRGESSVLIISIILGIMSVPLTVRAILRRPRANLIVVAAGLAGGALIGQPVFGWLHGTDLNADWKAPYDGSGTLTTEGVWTDGGSLVRVRVDQIVSYQSGTGQQQWTLSVPGLDIACALSGETAAQVGLIGYGSDGGACDHILAVDLDSGRSLWTKQVPVTSSIDQGTGLVAADGDIAAVATPGGVLAYNLRTGAPSWTHPAPAGCDDVSLAAGQRSIVAVAGCEAGLDVIDLDPASGARLWQTPVSEPQSNFQLQILSADPVVVEDTLPGVREVDHLRVFGADGRLDSSIGVNAIDTPDGTVGLDTSYYQGFGPEVVVADGLLVGVTKDINSHCDVVAFRLSDGQRQWLVSMPDDVDTVRQNGSEMLVVDDSQPVAALDEISIPSGSLHAIGFIPHGVSDFKNASVYPVGDRYMVVNFSGVNPLPPVAAVG